MAIWIGIRWCSSSWTVSTRASGRWTEQRFCGPQFWVIDCRRFLSMECWAIGRRHFRREIFRRRIGNLHIYIFSDLNTFETEFVYRYNEPQRLEMKNATKEEQLQPRKENKSSPLLTFLAGMKSGTKVFQHFLTKSNLTQVLEGRLIILLVVFILSSIQPDLPIIQICIFKLIFVFSNIYF